MMQRCNNPKDKDYANYGGRGIAVCKEWEDSFLEYYNWAMASGYKRGLTIDRENNDGDYNPSNCRFVTITENNRNRRGVKFNVDLVLEIRNAKLLMPMLTQQEVADAYGCGRRAISDIWNNVTWRGI